MPVSEFQIDRSERPRSPLPPSEANAFLLAPDQFQYLQRTCSLDEETLKLLLDVLLEVTRGSPEEYVRRRHDELRRVGVRNEEIFRRMNLELARGRFASPVFSPRQLQRIIYG